MSMMDNDTNEGTYLEILSDFTDETLERELPDQKLGGFLVLSDLTKSDGTRPESMGLLNTTQHESSIEE